jgi:hypothetical protein
VRRLPALALALVIFPKAATNNTKALRSAWLVTTFRQGPPATGARVRITVQLAEGMQAEGMQAEGMQAEGMQAEGMQAEAMPACFRQQVDLMPGALGTTQELPRR